MTGKGSDRLLLLELFLKVLERESVSEAAEELGLSQGRASKMLKELEGTLATELMRRNTRGVTATPAGLAFAEEARDLVGRWQRACREHSGLRRENVTLHVVAPVGLGQHSLLDSVVDYMLLNRGLKVRWTLENGAIDVYREGCDVWIALGPVADEHLIVREVGRFDSILVAAPSHPVSEIGDSPAELDGQEAVGLEPYFKDTLEIVSDGGERRVVEADVRILTNNFPSMYRAVRRGVGFAPMPMCYVEEDLESGTLRQLLPSWKLPSAPISLVYPHSPYSSPVLEGLLDFLTTHIPRLPGVLPALGTDD